MSNFWKNKNVSITGGYGFLGKYVRKKLEQRNCKKISACFEETKKKSYERSEKLHRKNRG